MSRFRNVTFVLGLKSVTTFSSLRNGQRGRGDQSQEEESRRNPLNVKEGSCGPRKNDEGKRARRGKRTFEKRGFDGGVGNRPIKVE